MVRSRDEKTMLMFIQHKLGFFCCSVFTLIHVNPLNWNATIHLMLCCYPFHYRVHMIRSNPGVATIWIIYSDKLPVVNFHILIFSEWYMEHWQHLVRSEHIWVSHSTSISLPTRYVCTCTCHWVWYIHVERLNSGKLHVRYTGQLEWLHVYSHPKVSE